MASPGNSCRPTAAPLTATPGCSSPSDSINTQLEAGGGGGDGELPGGAEGV